MIRFECPHCGKSSQVADQHAGKRGKCPGCGQMIAVPQPSAEEEPVPLEVVETPSGNASPGRPGRRWLIPSVAGGVALLAAVGLVAWWAGHRTDGQQNTPTAGQRLSPSGLPLLASGLYDPEGCRIEMKVLHRAQMSSTVRNMYRDQLPPIAISPDCQKLVYRSVGPRNAPGTPLGLWSPPAAPDDSPAILPVGYVGYDEYSGSGAMLVFSSDSKHVSYVGIIRDEAVEANGISRDRCAIVRDGVKSEPYPSVLHLTFSPDSQRLAALVETRKDNQIISQVTVDGAPGQEYDGWISPSACQSTPFRAWFSPDSRHLAYMVGKRPDVPSKNMLVVDGKETDLPGEPILATWSPDSRRLACVIRTGKGKAIIMDGAVVAEYPMILPYCIRFSADSKTLAFIASNTPGDIYQESGRNYFVVCGNKPGKEYVSIDQASLYVTVGGLPCYVAEPLTGGHVLVEGQKETVLEDYLFFSPDAASYAAWRTVHEENPLDIAPLQEMRINGSDPIRFRGAARQERFSSDGAHLFFVANVPDVGRKQVAMIDGLQGPEVPGHIMAVNFDSPDRIVMMVDTYRDFQVVEFRVVKK